MINLGHEKFSLTPYSNNDIRGFPLYAFEKAVPMDFIFKGGDYKRRITMVIDAPLSARVAGPDGSHFYIDFAGRSNFRIPRLTTTGMETYSADPNTVTIRSSAAEATVGNLTGLIYEPVTSSLARGSFARPEPKGRNKCGRKNLASEYQFIGFQTTITADVGTNAVLVQYTGYLRIK